MAIELAPGIFDAIIFDCDGTLVDTAAVHFRSFQAALGAHGIELRREWYLERTGLTPQALLLAFGDEVQSLPCSIADLLAEVNIAFQNNLGTLQEIAVVAAVVRQWHGRVPLAVASNGERANVEGSLRATGLWRYFDGIATIEDVQHGKPAPDVYLEAARKLKVAASRCYVLEDSDEGLRAARAAGMAALDVRPYLHHQAPPA